MNFGKKAFSLAALAISATLAFGPAQAKEDLKIGVVLSMSGPFSDYGTQILDGINLYIAQHGDTLEGRKIKIIVKDATGHAPAVAKRQAQERLRQAQVDIQTGRASGREGVG